jgi:hypothetical protein
MAKTEQRFNNVNAEEIPEVGAFLEVRDRLRAFRDANKDFFEYLDALGEEYNSKLEVAEKVVRGRMVSCSDFHLYQLGKKFNAELLYQSLGQVKFLEVGGIVATKTSYELDKTRFQSALAANQIPAPLMEVAVKDDPKYHMPPKVNIP